MLKAKMIAGLALVTIVLIFVFSTALAAPNAETFSAAVTTTPAAPIVGTVQTITLSTDVNNNTTVQVTLLDQNNVTQTVTLSVTEAVTLGLVTLDANNIPSENTAMIGQSVTIQPPAPTPTPTETAQNPVGAVIASFFGLKYSVVDGFHQEGTGYGVIAQACWMSYELNGDASACGAIIEAKKSGDYSGITLPDGTTPTNWGQFKKAVSEHKGPGQTLGAIVSGHAAPIVTSTPEASPSPEPSAEPSVGPSTFTQSIPGNGNPGQGNGNGNGNNNNGNGNGNGKNHDKGNNNGKGPNK